STIQWVVANHSIAPNRRHNSLAEITHLAAAAHAPTPRNCDTYRIAYLPTFTIVIFQCTPKNSSAQLQQEPPPGVTHCSVVAPEFLLCAGSRRGRTALMWAPNDVIQAEVCVAQSPFLACASSQARFRSSRPGVMPRLRAVA